MSPKQTLFSATAIGGLLLACHVCAQSFPAKPLRFIAMGTGFPENTARVIGNEITAIIKQQVIIEPRPGANGILAAEFVAKAPPDGYTLLIGTNSTHAANPSLYKKLPYHYVKDFSPVSGVSLGMSLLVVNPHVPAKSVAQLTALARKSPGQLTFGAGSSSGLVGMEFYKLATGINIANVPYKTVPQATTDLIAGRIDMMILNLGAAMPQVQAGKLRGLAVTGATRWAALPDTPTMQEAGVPTFEWSFWNAAWLPAGTPPEIVTRMNELLVAALAQPKVKTYLFNAGSTAFATTPDELMKFQIAEHDKWRKVILAAKIQAE